MEADVFPRDVPERAIVIDRSIGELSLFHQTFGYYAHGVDENTAILPDGWRDRLVKIENANTHGAIGWCLDPHDLAVSKLAAGREKDIAYLKAVVKTKSVSAGVFADRLWQTPRISGESRTLAEARLAALTKF